MTTSEGDSYYYSQDGLGSVRTLTDSAGAVQNSYDYTACYVERLQAGFEKIYVSGIASPVL